MLACNQKVCFGICFPLQFACCDPDRQKSLGKWTARLLSSALIPETCFFKLFLHVFFSFNFHTCLKARPGFALAAGESTCLPAPQRCAGALDLSQLPHSPQCPQWHIGPFRAIQAEPEKGQR